MVCENTNPKNGPIGKWDAESKRNISFSKEVELWIREKYEESNKMADYGFFSGSWRNGFENSLVEVDS